MTGTQKINKAIAKFDDITKDLEQGVADVGKRIERNQDIVARLKGENSLLGVTKVAGINMIRGIQNLINGDN